MATITAVRRVGAASATRHGPHREVRYVDTRRTTRSDARDVAGALSKQERTILILLGCVLAICALASRFEAPAAVPTRHVRVERGDTLWAIASENIAPGLSTAQTADLIMELNDLSSSNLAAGTEIDVPLSSEAQGGRLASR